MRCFAYNKNPNDNNNNKQQQHKHTPHLIITRNHSIPIEMTDASASLPIPAVSKSIVLNALLDEGVPDSTSFSIVEGEEGYGAKGVAWRGGV